MAPKGGNAKKESGRAKKAENEANKKAQAAAEKEKKESQSWKDGSKEKSSKEEKEEKRKAEIARKAENARLLAEEEAAAPVKVQAAPKATSKSKASHKVASPHAISAGGDLASTEAVPTEADRMPEKEVESFAATGIDNALDLLDVVTAKMDKASVGQQAAGIEKHPERRFKAAYGAYEDRELPNLKADHPGLRLQQYKEMLYKQFQKSPENPFNQSTVSYDASKEEKLVALKQKKEKVEERLRQNE